MVEFDTAVDRERRDEGVWIGDIDGTYKIQRNIRETIEECKGNGVRLEIPHSISGVTPQLVHGSYARGTAIKGESDLDLIIPIKKQRGEVNALLANIINMCMEDNESMLIRGFEEWFSGADIAAVPMGMEWVMALRFAIGRDEGKGRVVYNLESERNADVDEIVEHIIDDMHEGRLEPGEIDMVELEASPLRDIHVEELREAKHRVY